MKPIDFDRVRSACIVLLDESGNAVCSYYQDGVKRGETVSLTVPTRTGEALAAVAIERMMESWRAAE